MSDLISPAASQLIDAFNRVFLSHSNTCLRGGFEEPVYLPERSDAPAEIRFTRNYIRSALHEVAHWCIAGPARLREQDYGYWYRPDGRTHAEQQEFFRYEVKPQALEWLFSRRVGVEFQVSVDNLNGGVSSREDVLAFEKQVALQCAVYEREGMPSRAAIFLKDVLPHVEAT